MSESSNEVLIVGGPEDGNRYDVSGDFITIPEIEEEWHGELKENEIPEFKMHKYHRVTIYDRFTFLRSETLTEDEAIQKLFDNYKKENT